MLLQGEKMSESSMLENITNNGFNKLHTYAGYDVYIKGEDMIFYDRKHDLALKPINGYLIRVKP